MAKTKRLCILLLRLLAFGATLSAAVVMAKNDEKIVLYSLPFEASYKNSPAFKYFVVANAIGSVYSALALFVPPASLVGQSLVALDAVMAMLLTSSMSAAMAIAYVGKKGNLNAGWQPICGEVSKFCDHVMGAIIASIMGVVIYMTLFFLHFIWS